MVRACANGEGVVRAYRAAECTQKQGESEHEERKTKDKSIEQQRIVKMRDVMI